MRCVIFDLDGTLADTSGDLLAAANICFEGMGEDVRLTQDDAGIALRGGRAMLTAGLKRANAYTEERVLKWYPTLLEAYGGNIATHTRLYPGALEAVEQLRRDGYAVGIATNKPQGLAEALLRELGVRDLFASMIGADTLPVKKPDPAHFWAAVDQAGGNRDRALLVGDSDTDRNTAANAGAPSILVTFAPPGQAVRDLNPEGTIDHFDDLPAEVRRLIG
ncbi:HAD-IA family hydrolase [Tropicibacter naphthalenivorans]|uniref:phosphoglycolate phosphatase n=1 Tax=Tropicibacter naphthalenivorans TaxID=441103 RepID=A0A0P1GFE0_9RHOB|nr:HAD-IA family hydrolase [Tropicibacter naphthalenivorans]CUH80240.1 Phosphoglycolate phosphatase [Tropicibacter naphthalenivorans]SMC85632.1 phosphoglycolate phosphatase [Tropicibacter naphthalenivorans]